jgi:hypothetical protein
MVLNSKIFSKISNLLGSVTVRLLLTTEAYCNSDLILALYRTIRMSKEDKLCDNINNPRCP